MSRYDKYDPTDGGFRAPIGFNTVAGDLNQVWAVGLDANGRLVKGAGNTGVIGVLIVDKAKLIGDIVDVMTDGEIADFTDTTGAAVAAGVALFGAGATNAGPPSVTIGQVTVNNLGGVSKYVGWTVEGLRAVIRVARAAGAGFGGQGAAVTSLTLGPGAADDVIADVGAAFSQATLNNNFADVGSKINTILTRLRSAGIIA